MKMEDLRCAGDSVSFSLVGETEEENVMLGGIDGAMTLRKKGLFIAATGSVKRNPEPKPNFIGRLLGFKTAKHAIKTSVEIEFDQS